MSQHLLSLVAVVVFGLIALAHVARLVFRVSFVVQDISIPLWATGLAVVVMGFLACEGFRLARKSGSARVSSSSTQGTRPVIRIGPAGWSYKDWEGIVYPLLRPRGFHEATYLAQFLRHDRDQLDLLSASGAGNRQELGAPRQRQSAFSIHRQAVAGLHARAECYVL